MCYRCKRPIKYEHPYIFSRKKQKKSMTILEVMSWSIQKNYRRKKDNTVFLPLVIARLLERKEKCFFKKRPQFQQQSVQFSHSVVADSLRPHELQHARQKIKYLRIILTRNALHLHEDFKVDLKDTKGNLNKQKDTMGWSGRLLILKMSVFFTQIHKFNVTSIKIVTGFLMDNITARSN